MGVASQVHIGDDVVAGLRGPDGPLAMIQMAGVLRGLLRVELSLFSWLGRAARSCGSPEEVVWACSASLRAGWRAAQLETLLPVSDGLACEKLESGGPEMDFGQGRVLDVAAAWYEVLEASYRFRLDHLSPAADGQLGRVVQRVISDLESERATVETLRKRPGRSA
jgi:hypothetical protein